VFPSRTQAAPRRSGQVTLSMTSMIDVFVVLTVFLLLSFTTRDECGCIQRDLSQLPAAGEVQELLDAPTIHVGGQAMLVDGVPVATAAELGAFGERVGRLDGLFNVLKQKREVAKVLSPNRPQNTHVILAIDGDVSAGVVKSIVMTAAFSGYPSVDFMVHAVRPRG